MVAIPILIVNENNNFDTAFQIRPFLIMDDGYGILIIENPDYIGLKITTKKNKIKKVHEIENWKELGLKKKSYIRIEIPERIEEEQLIGKIATLPKKQFIEYYKLLLDIFNTNIIEKLIEKELEQVNNK